MGLDEHLPVLRGKPPQRLGDGPRLHRATDLIAAGQSFDGGVVGHQRRSGLRGAVGVGEQVSGDGEQPRPDRALVAPQRGGVTPGTDEDLLNDVLGALGVAGETQAEGVQGFGVGVMQGTHQCGIRADVDSLDVDVKPQPDRAEPGVGEGP